MRFFDLFISGRTYPRLSKRKLMHTLIGELIAAGAHPDELAPLLPWEERAWLSLDGALTAAQFRKQLPDRVDRYFMADGEPFLVEGRTFALTSQWGSPSWDSAITQLAERFPDLEIRVLPHAGPAGRQASGVDSSRAPQAPGAPPGGFPQLESTMLGAAGEYFVLFQLHRRGLLSALTPRGYKAVDIILLSPDQGVAASIQVKTRMFGHNGGWRMGVKHETVTLPDLYFCLVDLEPTVPVTFVVPADVVARAVAASYVAWRALPGHNDHDMRTLEPAYAFQVPGFPPGWLEPYRERWDLLAGAQDPAEG